MAPGENLAIPAGRRCRLRVRSEWGRGLAAMQCAVHGLQRHPAGKHRLG